MRLSRWQIFGVALSIIWVVGAAIHQRNSDVHQAKSSADFTYHVCTETKAMEKSHNLATCVADKNKMHSLQMEHSWENVAVAALAPLPILWILGTIVFYFSKAQVIGFRSAVPLRTMSPLNKAFVYFFCLFAVVLLYYGFLILLNDYTDAQVPVGLSPTKDFFANGDFVSASGTWVDPADDIKSLQTSTIECQREKNECIEARATVATGFGSGGTLVTDLYEYPIKSWTDAAIVFEDDGFCTSTTYTIDLNTEAVSGATHSLNPAPSTCTGNISRKLQLVAGFPIYWARRQAARPYALRVMQAVLGR